MTPPPPLKPPFPWFGGKSRAAAQIWARLGDPTNYVEPFAGSLAVPLARPGWGDGVRLRETFNDQDLLLTNFWRAVRSDAAAVARHADYPVSEVDLTARHRWLVQEARPRLRDLAMGRDPGAYDAQAAGWWVWGISQWIGSGWCPPIRVEDEGAPGRVKGLSEQMPNIDAAGNGCGVHQRVDGGVYALLGALQRRLRYARIVCGDWRRVLAPTALDRGGWVTCALLLDPPYDGTEGVYGEGEAGISAQVRAWCAEHGHRPTLRIALCGRGAEHDDLLALGWSVEGWTARRGYANATTTGSGARHAERVWYSPGCVAPAAQGSLLEMAQEAR